jgi:glycosyltransferase involved in cell wall biosynthesis
MTPKTRITAAVTAHREGLVARASLLSLSRAKSHAEAHGYEVETIVVLDQADALTTEVVEEWCKSETGIQIVQVDNGDPGLSRNDAVTRASGEWVAFLDADDLWCETWLTHSLQAAQSDRREVVWHPEVMIYFGTRACLFRHIDMESAEFRPSALLISNHWTSLCVATRALLLAVPYQKTDLENKIGYEDWAWNLAVMERQAIHKVVPGTGHAIRTKSSSRNMSADHAGAIPDPHTRLTCLFRNAR